MNAFAVVWQNPWVRVAVGVGIVYLVLQVLPLVATPLTVFLLAYLLAYLFNPMLDFLEKRRVRRNIGLLIVLCILLGVVGLLVLLLVTVFNQLTEFLGRLPELIQSANQLVQSTLRRVRGLSDAPMLQDYAGQLGQLWKDNVANFSKTAVGSLQGMLTQSGSYIVSFTSVLVQALFTVILAFYLMADYQRINRSMLRLFPERSQPRMLELSAQFSQAVGGYLRGQFTIALLEGALIALGLWMIGIPSALTLGFVAGVFGMVPYLGVVVSVAPALLLAFSQGWTAVGLVVLVFVVVNQLEGNVLSPWVLGKTTNLHPATVLVSLLIGVELFGVLGTLLAVPAAALFKLLIHNYYLSSRLYRSAEAHILQESTLILPPSSPLDKR